MPLTLARRRLGKLNIERGRQMVGGTDFGGRARGSRLRLVPWAVAVFVLLLPLVAMQFTHEVNWDETDFIVMGVLLFGSCGAFELAARLTGNTAYRAAVGVAVVSSFLLIWINLAVGIIGSEENPANLMYFAVVSVGLVIAFVSGFQPKGMALALLATALAQVAVAAITLLFGWGSDGENWPQVIVVLNGFFAALWLFSAWLFRKAARQPSQAPAAV